MSEAKPGAPDPSMEDILASIRKILNEDEQATETAAAGDGPVLLTAEMMISPPEATRLVVPPEPAEAAPAMAAVPEASLPLPAEASSLATEPAVAPVAAPITVPELVAAPVVLPITAPEAGLVAPAAAAAAAAALGQLSRAVAQDRGAAVSRSGLSIEDVVREELRPLLKEWLDTHLPGITERLVRAEIERVMARQG